MRRIVPNPDTLRNRRSLKFLGTWLYQPQYWITTRRSTSRGIACGMFWAWIPVPATTLWVILSACTLRANVPIAAVSIWVNNPLTIAPMMWFAHTTGAMLLGQDPGAFEFQLTSRWLTDAFSSIWRPLLAGAFSLGVLSAILGFIVTEIFWRTRAMWRWKKRQPG